MTRCCHAELVSASIFLKDPTTRFAVTYGNDFTIIGLLSRWQSTLTTDWILKRRPINMVQITWLNLMQKLKRLPNRKSFLLLWVFRENLLSLTLPQISLNYPTSPINKKTKTLRFGFFWLSLKIWAAVDSNHRPHPYQGCALTTWASSPYIN